jgi:hypothetical protein
MKICFYAATARNTPGLFTGVRANITLGVNVLMMLTEQTARCLPEFDYAITEKHHSRKADVIRPARKIAIICRRYWADPYRSIPYARAGMSACTSVMAVSEYERITIIHESFSRRRLQSGAVIAADYLLTREGYFEMRDVVPIISATGSRVPQSIACLNGNKINLCKEYGAEGCRYPSPQVSKSAAALF